MCVERIFCSYKADLLDHFIIKIPCYGRSSMKDQLPSMFYALGLLQVQGKKIEKKRKRSMVSNWLTNDMRTIF